MSNVSRVPSPIVVGGTRSGQQVASYAAGLLHSVTQQILAQRPPRPPGPPEPGPLVSATNPIAPPPTVDPVTLAVSLINQAVSQIEAYAGAEPVPMPVYGGPPMPADGGAPSQ